MRPSPVTARRLWSPLWEQARQRPARLHPATLAGPTRALALLAWVGAAIMLTFGFLPGVFEPQEVSLYGGALRFGYAPIWPLLCGLAIGSGVAAAGYLNTAMHPGAPRHHGALAWCAGIATPLIPVLILAVDRVWQTVPAFLAWLTGTVGVVVCLHLRRRAPAPWVGVLLAAVVAAPWIPAIVANIRFGRALDAAARDESHLLHLLVADLPAKTYVPGIALAFIAAMATAGVAMAAHSRAAVAQRISSRGRWRVSAGICTAAVVLIALEVSGVGGISSGFIDTYWELGDRWTWPHAVVVALAITAVAQRSFRSPLLQRGDVATTLAIGVSTLSGQIVLALTMTTTLIVSAVHGPQTPLITPPPGSHLLITWVALAALVPVAVAARWRDTAGRSVARVSLLFLLPVATGVTVLQLGGHWPVVFWAKAPQVAICLTLIGCLATLFGALGRQRAIGPELVNRLVLIPLLLVSGASWLPSVIATPLTPVIAVTAALFALLWAMPSDDQGGHTGVVLTVSAQLLLVAAAAALVTVLPDVAGDDTTLAVLLFSVPLSTLLCAKVRSADA